MSTKKTNRTCPNGHRYFKSSDCPVCPVCESGRVPEADFLRVVSAPARRALENAGITSLVELAKWSETDLLKLHGIGKTAIPKLKAELYKQKRAFQK